MSASITASPTTHPRRLLALSDASNSSSFARAVITTTSTTAPAAPRARPPVDATERIARPVLANPEQLVAGTRPWHRGACLQLAGLTQANERHQPGQHQPDLRVRTRPLTAEETERVTGPDRPTAGPDGSSPQLAKNL